MLACLHVGWCCYADDIFHMNTCVATHTYIHHTWTHTSWNVFWRLLFRFVFFCVGLEGGINLVFEGQFYLGPPASGAPAHWHSSAINVMAFGNKRWALFPPNNGSFYSIKPSMDFFKWDLPEMEAQGPVRCRVVFGAPISLTSWIH